MAEHETEQKGKDYRKHRGGLLFAIVSAVLILLAVVASCTVFFRVETVVIEGNERYSQQEILAVISSRMGTNMILTPGDQLSQQIYNALPYVDEVKVQKRFPTTLRIEITETEPAAVISGAGSSWLIDAKGKLLEEVEDAGSYTVITGLELLEPKEGELAQTTQENQKVLTNLTALTQGLAEYDLLEDITSIDVSSQTEIIMDYDNRLTIKLLGSTDYSTKLTALKTIIAIAGEDGKGTINMKSSDKVIWSMES